MRIRNLILAVAISLSASSAFAAPKPKSNFRETLSQATIPVYHGKQVCKYTNVDTFFGSFPEWGCKFESRFTCTATVVGRQSEADYIGLTAGHCFDWKKKDEYYVSEQIGSRPVLRKIKLIKFESENDDRYDFALFEFSSSMAEYPVIEVDYQSKLGPAVGSLVFNTNFSFGLVKQFTEGKVISDIIFDPAIASTSDLKGRYLVAIGLGPGASGSAVVDSKHKIVGIVEAIFPGTQMPTVVMPTGQTLAHFMDDDSAGLQPKDEPKKNPQDGKPSMLQRMKEYLFG